MNQNILKISNLTVEVEGNIVLSSLNLEIDTSKINVLIGPNGAGKSTLANVLMGNPIYEIVEGDIFFQGEVITELSTEKRAKLGLFLSFQHPVEIEGVSMLNFLKSSYSLLKDKPISILEFTELLDEKMSDLNMDSKFKSRFLNHNFSGGEKKKSEVLQMLLFEPKFSILDEIDSGLDIDAVKIVGKLLDLINKEKKMGMLLVSHSNKLLDCLDVDKVFVLENKSISKVGGKELLDIVESLGFDS